MAETEGSDVLEPDEALDEKAAASADTEPEADLRPGGAGDETLPDPNSHTR